MSVKSEIEVHIVDPKKIEILLPKILLIFTYFFCAIFHPLLSEITVLIIQF